MRLTLKVIALGGYGREPREPAGQQLSRPEVEESGSRQPSSTHQSSATVTWAQLRTPATLHDMFCSRAGQQG